MSIITVNNLTREYEYYHKSPGLKGTLKSLIKREIRSNTAVKNISFSIEEGELVGFIGPNGAGKTTTLKMLSGIIHPTSGEASVLGFTPWLRQNEFKKQFTMVMGQKNQLWEDLPAMDSFILNKELYNISDKEFNKNLDEIMTMLDIKEYVYVQTRKLSLGERMKCELAAALLHLPKVIFLDEPTIGLDVTAQKKMREFIKQYNQKQKTTIILTSHYMKDIEELCKRVIVIDHGEILYDGPLENLVNKYAPHKLLTIIFNNKGVNRDQVKQYGDIKSFGPDKVIFKIDRKSIKQTAATILASSLPVADIMIDNETIDDIIHQLFQEQKL